MSKSKFDPEVYVALREAGKTNYDIAQKLGVDEASVRRGLRRANYQPYLLTPSFISAMAVQLEVPLRIDVASGGGAVVADFHHPLTNYTLVNQFIDQARDSKNTKFCAIIGDWFNVDYLSAFDSKQDEADAMRELYGSQETMERLLDTFETIYITWGNHDARFHKALGYKVAFTRAMQMLFSPMEKSLLDRIVFTNLDHLWLDTPRGAFFACHPKSYSQVPLTQGRKLASKYLCNVLTGHSHHSAIGHDVSGKFVIAELGGFFDATKTEYLQRSTAFPNWQNGWSFIDKQGYLHMEAEGWSVGRRGAG